MRAFPAQDDGFILTLTRLEAFFDLVDHINAAAPTDNLAILVPFFQCFQRVYNFHCSSPQMAVFSAKPDTTRPQPILSSLPYKEIPGWPSCFIGIFTK